jgi:uncharacterized protein YraI
MPNGPSTEEPAPAEHGPFGPAASGEPPPPKLEPRVPSTARPRAAPSTALSSRWDAWLPLLNNRAILSGLGLVIVLLLTAIVLVSIGHGNQGTHRAVVAIVTPEANSTALPRGSLSGHIVTTASVRNGPNATYSLLGTVPKGASVAVIGRNSDESWLQIRYPPGSSLLGWVDAQFLETTGDVSLLGVAGPGPGPSVPLPTGSAPPTAIPTAEEATPTPTEEAPQSATATPTLEAQLTPTEQPQQTPTLAPQPTATPLG